VGFCFYSKLEGGCGYMDKPKPEIQFLAHYRESDQEGQELWDHLRNVGDLASQYAGKVGLSDLGKLLGLLHDLGKATHEFDTYIRHAVGLLDQDVEFSDAKLDHSTAGAQFVYSNLTKSNPKSLAAQIMALAIASHHSGLFDCISPDGDDLFTKRMNKPECETRVSQAVSNIDPAIYSDIENLLNSDLDKQILSFFHVNRDGLDGEEELSFKLGLLTRLLFSCLIDADRTDTADFENKEHAQLRQRGIYPAWSVLIERLESRLSQFKVRSSMDVLRRDISEKCKQAAIGARGLYRLTVPTGGGKTLASLRFALYHAEQQNMDRIIYVIPYTSIIDQNANEIRTIMEVEEHEKGRIVLEHHSNIAPEKDTKLNRILAENWDAPIVMTTMVQFLEALFGSGTNSCRRMHQLVNSVIIFDEIQNLPIRCVYLFNLAIRFLVNNCHATVMLCTATQPLLHKVSPKTKSLPYEEDKVISASVDDISHALSRTEIIDLTMRDQFTFSEAASFAYSQLEHSNSVLFIVNTKKAAYEIYQNLPNDDVIEKYHLSTNMCPAHRLDVIQKIRLALEHLTPIICVSTQLIEAGVDVDFGVVIRSLAGLDSVAQAAGRCNRHNLRQDGGKLYLLRLEGENVESLVDIREGQKVAMRVLSEYRADPEFFTSSIIGPKALDRYFEYYFYQRRELMGYPVDKDCVGRRDTIYNLLACNKISVDEHKNRENNSPAYALRQAFSTANKAFKVIDNFGQGVIVPYGVRGKELVQELCGAFDLEKQYQLLREAQRYTVNCYPHLLLLLSEQKAVHEVQKGTGIFYLDKQYYDERFGLHAGSTLLMDVLAF